MRSMTSDESRRFRLPRSFFAEQVAAREASQRFMDEQLKAVRRERRRRVAHEEASPLILETLHLLVEKIDRVERDGRRTIWLTLLIAMGTVALVVDLFVR
jgi:hypothetical protein